MIIVLERFGKFCRVLYDMRKRHIWVQGYLPDYIDQGGDYGTDN